MKRIVRHIPNAITSMNLLCGVAGVLCCLKGELPAAFCLMLAASVFDFCDGLAARLLGAYSPMGKELDSLADLVSFGVLPSVMTVCLALSSFAESPVSESGADSFLSRAVVYSPVLVAVFSGLRLAKFNVDDRQSENFIGLATPACAMLLGSLVCFTSLSGSPLAKWLADWSVVRIAVPLLSVLLSWLLVSEIPMFAMKIKKGAHLLSGVNGKLRVAFFAGSVAILVATPLLSMHISIALFFIFLYYIILNISALPFRTK